MPNLVVTCPTCGHERKLPKSAIGVTGKCEVCGAAFKVSEENARPDTATQATPESTTSKKPAAARQTASRIESMDQLRGYAIFGMILVDFLGNFPPFEGILGHQRDRYSYADTIAPLFLFVVGMGFRLSLVRRIERDGLWEARWAALKRYATLFIIAIFFYGPSYQKDWWDALTEIALAGVLTLPFIDKKATVRIAAGLGYLGLYMIFFLGTDYGHWLRVASMNGGPLGSLGSAFVLLCGTIAYDLLDSGDTRAITKWSLILGVGLCVSSLIVWRIMPTDIAAYADFGHFWPFAKRWMAAPFQLMSAGICFLTFLGFYWLCDVKAIRIPHLSILGENPLVIYLVQYSLFEMNETYITPSKDPSQIPIALLGFVCVYLFCYAVAKRLHDQGYIIKL